ncbi:MAG: hypothetical protein C0417_10185 [Chlorobiaceae bacterium]|nr:hypothetical protein [Chlorobiaceae bacterium]
MTIQQSCDKINNVMCNEQFTKYYSLNDSDFNILFTSLDLIEDCQNAIEEYEGIPEDEFPLRSTLYIYGVLQSMYCQQDGLFHLYEIILNDKRINEDEFYKRYNFTQIRAIRNDIAGHPSYRNKGKKVYFIAKGPNSKYKFKYAGYTPGFREVHVDLKKHIEEQSYSSIIALIDIKDAISKNIQLPKDKF